MAIFGFGKKKEKEEAAGGCGCCSGCGSSGSCAPEKPPVDTTGVKVLGSGCAKCNELTEATVTALGNLGMDTTVDHVTDFVEIAAYGVMSTPALVVDGKVLSYGKVLKVAEVEALIKTARA